MSRKKTISLISGICGLLLGIVILVATIMDAAVPKLLCIVLAAACIANAVLILLNFKNKN